MVFFVWHSRWYSFYFRRCCSPYCILGVSVSVPELVYARASPYNVRSIVFAGVFTLNVTVNLGALDYFVHYYIYPGCLSPHPPLFFVWQMQQREREKKMMWSSGTFNERRRILRGYMLLRVHLYCVVLKSNQLKYIIFGRKYRFE